MNMKAAGLAGALVISSLAASSGQAFAAAPAHSASGLDAYADTRESMLNANQPLKLANQAERSDMALPNQVALYSDDLDRHHHRHHRHHDHDHDR